jgi:hypothetical protein
MSQADILFQYYTTTANTTTTEAELAFQAEQYGVTMISSLFAASSAGGNSNVYRVHHCGADEEPDPSNCILYAKSTANSSLPNAAQSVKIVLNPGDRIFCQLHSGDGITITGYGLRPMQPSINQAMPAVEHMSAPNLDSLTITNDPAMARSSTLSTGKPSSY